MVVTDTCILHADCGVSPDDVLELAERLAASSPRKAGNRAALGMALYRAGRYEEAAAELRRSLALRDYPIGRIIYDSWDQAFLAAALQKLNHSEANAAYVEAMASYESVCGLTTPSEQEGVRPVDVDWLMQTELQLLMKDLHGK